MDQNENWKEVAASVNRSYSLGRLREIGLPEGVVTKLGACLFALTQHGGETWKIWCGDILKHLAPYREIEGLRELVAFAETHAGSLPTLPSRRSTVATAIAPTVAAPVASAIPETVPDAKSALADRNTIVTPEPQTLVGGGDVSSANGQDGQVHEKEETILEPAAPEVKPDAVAKPEHAGIADTHDGGVAPQNRDAYMLPISEIAIDETIQPRAKLDQSVVDEYADAYRRGDKLPPVIVFSDFDTHLLADGFHRIAGAEKAGLAEIEVDLRMGDRRKAILYAVSANTTHGLRRTNADKHRAVEILLTDAEWCQWSDNEVARRAGVSQPFVSKLRADLSNNGYKIDGQRKVTRGDTEYTMDTEGIGGAAEDETEDLDGVVDVDAQPGTVEPDVSGNDDAGEDAQHDEGATNSESVANGDADADALIPKSSAKLAGAGMQPTAVDVFAAFYHVFGDWVSRKKVDKVTASKFFNDVRLEIERSCPGFYDKAIESATAARHETEVVKAAEA